MRAVLPGEPQAKLQAVCTGKWAETRVVVSIIGCFELTKDHLLMISMLHLQAYISGNALILLSGPSNLLQTIYQDEASDLEAVTIDESSGKIATCTGSKVLVYKPYGQDEGALKVKAPVRCCFGPIY
jgi:hypothetical protein